MDITINKNSTLDILFAAEIAKKYYKNEYFQNNQNLFIKMCKLLKFEANLDNIDHILENNIYYIDIKQWILSIFPYNTKYNNKILTYKNKIQLIQHNITHLPKCKCSKNKTH